MSIYWGEKGEYGPFTAQDNGWPHAGEVIRHYRRNRKMSAEELARRYGEAIGEQVTARWILKMEQQNKVPTDITRRQALVKILDIPPALLGVSSLELILFKPEVKKEALPTGPVILKQTPFLDLAKYEREIRTLWLLNETSHAHDALGDVLTAIRELEELEEQAKGNLQCRVRELLYSHYRLATRIYRDLMELPLAYASANQAVRVTKSLNRDALIAAALYIRGFIRLVWGLYGEKALFGIVEPHREKLIEALRDFEQAIPLARPQLKGLLLLEMSRAQSLLKGSATDITVALRTMELAEKTVESEGSHADPYQRMLLDGTLNGLNEEEYLLGKAITLNAAGRSNKALEEFEVLERLNERKRRGKDYTRYHAWIDIVQAQAYLGAKEYYMATDTATKALVVLRDIDSVDNITNIRAIHDELLKSSYRGNKEVNELGKILTKYYQSRKRKQP